MSLFYHVRGELILCEPGVAAVECGGVAYLLTVSLQTTDKISDKLGQEVKLLTHLQTREDGVDLFGFADQEELRLFRLLTSVSGVGPKVAMGVLSAFSPEKLVLLLSSEDVKALSKAPGVGAKTAARIILELKEKVAGLAPEGIPSTGGRSALFGGGGTPAGKLSEAAEALTSLGYSRAEAADILRKLDTSKMSLEEIVTAALRLFAKKG